MLNDSLVGLTGFRKAVILTVTVYYSTRIHININQGKGRIRESRTNQDKLPFVLAKWSHREKLIPPAACLTTHVKCCQPGKLITGEAHLAWCPQVSHMGMQTPQSRVQTDTVGPEASGTLTTVFPLNHVVSRLSGVYRASKDTRQAGHSKGPEVISKAWAKGKS